jgi:AcrR family transcriptional regulator
MTGHTASARSKEEVLTAYRRDALLNAAVRVFGEGGFDSATMERIAHEADVAKGTTYLYYTSKQSIYDAALARGLAEIDSRTQAAMEQAATLRDAITAFLTTRAEYFFQNRDFFRMYVGAIARRITSTNAKPSEIQSLVDRQPRRLEQAIARAVERREIRRVDPAATALAIFDITRGLVARRLASSGTRDVTEDAQFVADLIWKGLKKEARKEQGKRNKEEGRRIKEEGLRKKDESSKEKRRNRTKADSE